MSTDTELEDRLAATLRAKAAQVPDVAGSFDPTTMTLTDVVRRRRRSPLLVAAAVVVIVVVAALGLTVALDGSDASGPKLKPSGYIPPTGPPLMRLDIEALPELKFNAKDYTAAPGIIEVAFTSLGGTHRLVFEDPALGGFHLDGYKVGIPSVGKVELSPDHAYTIYCTLPGHRAAGMEAVIHTTTDVSTTSLPDRASTTTLPEGTTTTLPEGYATTTLPEGEATTTTTLAAPAP